MRETAVLLTVCIPAYNAEKYIEETLESVVSQRTTFPFEVLISDDCSTDSTLSICKEYASKYPNVTVIHQEKNLGMAPNQHFVLSTPNTPYLAYLDSDDYYAAPDFLQRQVDFLKAHPEVVVAFSNVEVFSDNGVIKQRYTHATRPPEIFDLHYFIKQNVQITNSAMVIRRSAHKDIPGYFTDYFQYDWLLHLYHGLKGKFGYNGFLGTRYRVHEANATRIKSEKVLRDGVRLAPLLNKILPDEYKDYFKHNTINMNKLAFFYLRRGRYTKFVRWYIQWFWFVRKQNIRPRVQWYRFKQSLKGATS